MLMKITCFIKQKYRVDNESHALADRKHEGPSTYTCFIRKFVSVDIMEPEEDAFVLSYLVKSRKNASIYGEHGEPVRRLNGNYYRPAVVQCGMGSPSVLREYDVRKLLESQMARKHERGNHATYKSDLRSAQHPLSQNLTLIEDDENQVMHYLKKITSEYVYFQGKFWVWCQEPCYMAVKAGVPEKTLIAGFPEGTMDNATCFQISERQQAIGYILGLCKNEQETDIVQNFSKSEQIFKIEL